MEGSIPNEIFMYTSCVAVGLFVVMFLRVRLSHSGVELPNDFQYVLLF